MIEFKCISKKREHIYIQGYVFKNELDDEKPFCFYDEHGLECGNYIPSNPFQINTDDWNIYAKLSSTFQSDDLFLQFLSDYADEDKTVDRDGYFLQINDGAKMELEITSASNCPNMEGCSPYWVKIIPKFNQNNILKEYSANKYWYSGWNDLIRDIDSIYCMKDGFIKDNACWVELPSAFFEWSSEYDTTIQKEIIEEVTDIYKENFAHILTDELNVGRYSEVLEQELDNDLSNANLYLMSCFVGKNEEFKQYLIENGYEF